MSETQRYYRNRLAEDQREALMFDEYAKLRQMYGDLEDKYGRLRETLQKIAAMPLSASWRQHFYNAVRMAQDVLQENEDADA